MRHGGLSRTRRDPLDLNIANPGFKARVAAWDKPEMRKAIAILRQRRKAGCPGHWWGICGIVYAVANWGVARPSTISCGAPLEQGSTRASTSKT